MITRIERWLAAWQDDYVIDGNSLGCYRILYCVLFALFIRPSYAWIGGVPKAFYDPPLLSFASFFDGFPNHAFFLFLDVLIYTSLVCVALGLFTRCSTGTLLIALLAGNNFQYSFGKIDHAIFLQCVLFVMLVINWGKSLSIDQKLFKYRDGGGSLWMLAVFLAFGFFSAGFGKALHWIDFDPNTSGFLFWLYGGYYSLGRNRLLATAAVELRPLWIWEIADILAVVFELGFLFVLPKRRLFVLWLLAACIFHLANCLVLNISFAPYSICYLAFVPWSKLIPPLARLSSLPAWSFSAIGLAMILIAAPFGWLKICSSSAWELERGAIMWLCDISILTLVAWKWRAHEMES